MFNPGTYKKALLIIILLASLLWLLPAGGVSAEDPLVISDLDLWQSEDTTTWSPVDGPYAAGFRMALDPAVEYYYLDTQTIDVNRPIEHGYYEFFVEEYPAGYFDYWADRGVVEGAGSWQAVMWQIINGDAPIFYLRVDADGFMLVDGLQKALYNEDHPLRINGDYLLGDYLFSGYVEGVQVDVPITFMSLLEITDLDLWQSEDTVSWSPVPGSYAEGFSMVLDPAVEYYYLDTQAIDVNRPIEPGYYEFFVAEYPAGYFDYWADRGVVDGAGGWQAFMWEIINGNEPIFYLRVDGDGFMLVDGLQKAMGAGDQPLRIDGAYLLGDYVFSGYVESVQVDVAITFIPKLVIADLDLWQSEDTVTWSPVPGSYAEGFSMVLDPAVEYYYLDTQAIDVNRPIEPGYYEFFVAEYPAGYFDYWADRGVVDGAGGWQAFMWEIINGNEPIFYLRVDGDGFMLVDGLQKAMGAGDQPLRIDGAYLLGDYVFSGLVETAEVAVAITFLPFLPDLVVTKSNDVEGSLYYDQSFTWTILVENQGFADAIFEPHQVVLHDQLPAGAFYSGFNADPIENLICGLYADVILCFTGTEGLTLPVEFSFSVSVGVAPTGLGNLENTAYVDPANQIDDLDLENNTSTDIVNVVDYPPAVLQGLVQGLEVCDLNPLPLAGVSVEVYLEEVLIDSFLTDVEGLYDFELVAGTYRMVISKEGYLTQEIESLTLQPGQTTTFERDLRLEQPCLNQDQTDFLLVQPPGTNQAGARHLVIHNTGAGGTTITLDQSVMPYTFHLLEEGFEGGQMPPAGGWETVSLGDTQRTWTVQQLFTSEGQYAAGIQYDIVNQSNEWLISPVIDTTDADELSIQFMVRSRTDRYQGATLKIWVLEPDDIVSSDPDFTPATDAVWDMLIDEDWEGDPIFRQVAVDMSEYDNHGPLRLAWQYVGKNGESVVIDQIIFQGRINEPWLIFGQADAVLSSSAFYFEELFSTQSAVYDLPADSSLSIPLDVNTVGLLPGEYQTTILGTQGSARSLFSIPFTLHVGEQVSITSADSAVFRTEEANEFIITTSGALTPVITMDGALPPGVDFVDQGDGTARLSGAPQLNDVGEILFTVLARTEDGETATQAFTLTITDQPVHQIFLPLILR